MKTLLKATLAIGILSMFATSCTSKKQHCDAYGAISKIETAKKTIVETASDELILEKKS